MDILRQRLETSWERKLAGKRLIMSYTWDRTPELWKSFMPRRKEIAGAVNDDLISMSNYPAGHFTHFNPDIEFEKWAALEVEELEAIPAYFETFIIPAGLYAIFDFKGSSGDSSVFKYIFGIWLPSSDYMVDDRPHFEVLGSKYKNNDPTSEEEIWIPVKPKRKDPF